MLVQGVKKLNVLVVFLGQRSVSGFCVIIISINRFWYFILLILKFYLLVVESGKFSAVCCMIFMLCFVPVGSLADSNS